MQSPSKSSVEQITSPKQTVASSKLTDCIESCEKCHAVCLRTINHCLEKGGHHAEAGHIRLMLSGSPEVLGRL